MRSRGSEFSAGVSRLAAMSSQRRLKPNGFRNSWFRDSHALWDFSNVFVGDSLGSKDLDPPLKGRGSSC